MTTETTIATHTFESAPSTSHAPNGSVVSRGEVVLHTVSIFEANYYGDGSKVYAKGFKRIRLAGSKCPGPRFGGWSDGHPEARGIPNLPAALSLQERRAAAVSP